MNETRNTGNQGTEKPWYGDWSTAATLQQEARDIYSHSLSHTKSTVKKKKKDRATEHQQTSLQQQQRRVKDKTLQQLTLLKTNSTVFFKCHLFFFTMYRILKKKASLWLICIEVGSCSSALWRFFLCPVLYTLSNDWNIPLNLQSVRFCNCKDSYRRVWRSQRLGDLSYSMLVIFVFHNGSGRAKHGLEMHF